LYENCPKSIESPECCDDMYLVGVDMYHVGVEVVKAGGTNLSRGIHKCRSNISNTSLLLH
jgi:hypothetical protein